MYLFLDESGDLGFDLSKKGTSRFFVITILACEDTKTVNVIIKAVNKTLKKINYGKKKNFYSELKGTYIALHAKRYFLNKISNKNWRLYSVIINKKNFRKPKYIKHSHHLYNYIATNLFDKITLDNPQTKIIISTDKCKSAEETRAFNRNIEEIFYSKLNNINNLVIKHKFSNNDRLIQAVDLFCNGLFAKYEHQDLIWYSYFQNKIIIEDKF